MNDLLILFQQSKLNEFYANDRIIPKKFMIGYMEAYRDLYNELLEIPQKIVPVQQVKESFVKRIQTILFTDIKTLLSKSRELVKVPTAQELAHEYYEKYFTESFEQESHFLTTEYGIRWHIWRIFDRFFSEPMAKSKHNWRRELGVDGYENN